MDAFNVGVEKFPHFAIPFTGSYVHLVVSNKAIGKICHNSLRTSQLTFCYNLQNLHFVKL